MGRIDDIQTALKPLKKIIKNEKYISMTTLVLAESFKTMNTPGPTETLFDDLFIGKYRR